MALHSQCKAFLDMLAAAGGPGLHEMPLDEARKVPYQMIELGGAEEPVAQVDTRLVPGSVQIPVRVYRPSLAQDLPALMFFHGGGFVVCNLDTHDRACRMLANASGCVVVSVDYRLAPEHRFPAAAEDAYGATRYVAEHAAEFGIDPTRIAVGGDSAGGNLATVVAFEPGLQLLERVFQLQLLFHPRVFVCERQISSLPIERERKADELHGGRLATFAHHLDRNDLCRFQFLDEFF